MDLEEQLNTYQSKRKTDAAGAFAPPALENPAITNAVISEDEASKSHQLNEPMLGGPSAADDSIPTHLVQGGQEEGQPMSSMMMPTTGQYVPEAIQAAPAPLYKRVIVCIVGCFLGFITLPANMMLSDSGTDIAQRASLLGVIASCLCCIGGVHAYCSKRGGWCSLSLGVVFQVAALLVLG